ncbi:DUF1289 domain-containing protein [Wenzhouxiangella sp. 15181]|nr:DUF1289 domain-containing protein [Wenzhouxiangella sp. 15181]RFP70329.1 DUF1289 domain-containing protein [Wenzhouxiangella sp. 15190]
MESPCIGTCTLGPGGLCVGCFRSATEIAGWLGYSPEKRREIMQALPARADCLFDED